MELNVENLKKLMQFRPTLNETALYFDVSPDTIERKIKKWSRCTFSEFREMNSLELKQRLREKAIDLALNGNATMMIFCLKNLCGWVDKVEQQEADRGPIILIGPNNIRPPPEVE